MKNRPWWMTFKRFLSIFLLSFVLYALVDQLYISLLPLRLGAELVTWPVQRTWESDIDIRQDVSYWRDILLEQPPLTRTITISATPAEITLDLNLWVTNTHFLVPEAGRGALDDATLPFAQAAFGEIYVEYAELAEEAYSDPVWTLDPDSQLAYIHVQAYEETDEYASIRVQQPVTSPITPAYDVLVVEFEGLHLKNLYPVPDKVTQNSTYLERTTPDTIGYLSYYFEPLTEFRESSTSSSRADREPRQRFLQRLGDMIDLPLISRMLYSVVRVFPLVLFLLLVVRFQGEKPPFVISLSGMVLNLLLFHFTLYFLSASAQIWDDDFPLVGRLSELVTNAIAPYFQPKVHPLFGMGASRVSAPVLGILLPALFRQRSGDFAQRIDHRRGRFIRSLVMVMLIGGLLIPIVYGLLSQWAIVLPMAADAGVTSATEFLLYWKWLLTEKDMLVVPLWSVALFASSLLAFLIWWVLSCLYRLVTLENPPPGLTLLAMLLIFLMATFTGYAQGVPNSWQTWEPWFWLVLSTILGFVLLLSLAKVVYPLVQQALPGLTLPPWGRQLLLALMVALVIPMAKLVNSGWSLASYNTIIGLAFPLVEWIVLTWAAGILYLLYQAGQDKLEIEAPACTLGILGISCYLFNTAGRWLYIPITFLIGWLTLKLWFVGSPSNWDILRSSFEDVAQKRAQWLDHILDLRVAERAYRGFRRKLGEKLAEGELTFSKYDSQLEMRRGQLDSLRARVTQEDQPIKELALSFGPYSSSWQNGVHGAKFAFLFGLPWIALYLKDFLSGPMPSQTYPLWGFGADLLTVVLRWTTCGFFLGYFYPYLRGKTGLQKGLGLSLVSVAPALPLMALFNTSATDWQASLFWALQVFIHCMLLGLVAFDYVILHQEGYEWQMLFEVHGLPSLGVSVSSILVAVGAAVTTLLTGQATEIMKAALTFVIPQIPPDLLLPK